MSLPPRIATAAAVLLLLCQGIGLLLLPSSLVIEAFQPPAPVADETAAKAAKGSFCVLGGECPPMFPTSDADPCKLICVASAGALSWLSLTGVVPEAGGLAGPLDSVPLPVAAPQLLVDRPARPLVPPPRG